MNVSVRKGIIEVLEDEVLKNNYLGYTSHAECIHDGARLLILIVFLHKISSGKSVESDALAQLMGALVKVTGEK